MPVPKSSHRLALRLQLWVLLAGLPALIMGVLLAVALYQLTIASAERGVELAARQAMDTLDRLMFERYGDVEVFAGLPSVRTLDREKLQAVANLYVTTYAPYYALAAVVDRTGKVLAINDVDSTGQPVAVDLLVKRTVASEPWFIEAMAHPHRIAVYDGAGDTLSNAVVPDGKPTIVFARAISEADGRVIGIWSAHILVESLIHVFGPMEQQGMKGGVRPSIVLKKASGERLLTIGSLEQGAPVAVIPSKGFSRWPGGRWILEAYTSEEFQRQRWVLVCWGSAAIALFTVTGTAALAWIFRRQLVVPLIELQSQVLSLQSLSYRPRAEALASGSSLQEIDTQAQDLLLKRDDELGDIARLLHGQTQEIQLHLNQLVMLNDSSRGILEEVASLPLLLDRILQTAKALTGARYAALGVFDESGERLMQFLSAGVDDDTKRAIGRLPAGRGLLGAVIKKEGVLRLTDLTQHAESVGFPPHHPVMHSFLGISIRAHGKLFGRLYLTDKMGAPANGDAGGIVGPGEGEFTALDEELIAALAFQAGTAIETAGLIDKIRTTQIRDRALLDSVDEGIYGVDLDGRCLFINRAGAEMLGYSQDALVGRDMHAAIHHAREDGAPYPATECPIVGTLQTHHGCRIEQEWFWRNDGTSFPVMCTVTLLREEAGTVTGAVVSFADLTERRALEARVQQSQKMEALGQLAASVAHDFNNLLTVMTGYSDLALLDADMAASLRTKIEEIKKATDRAAVVTGHLLAFARKKPVARQVVNLKGVVCGLESLIRRLVGESIEVDIALPDERWFVRIDLGGFEQVLVNLVVNARDAMPNGGRLVIRGAMLDCTAAGSIPVQGLGGPAIMMTVHDTGIGMDKATQARIFEPFVTTKPAGRGTGLGLAIVQRILMENEGGIYVTSTPGVGTTFTVVLPLVDPPAEGPDKTAGAVPVRGGDETVLLVEDDASVQALAKAILESRGYRVLTAHDRHEGMLLSQHHEGGIHLLVSNARMPHLKDQTMARRLLEQRPDLKILFLTSSLNAGLEKDSALLRLGHVLPKPFTSQALLEAVRRVLDAP